MIVGFILKSGEWALIGMWAFIRIDGSRYMYVAFKICGSVPLGQPKSPTENCIKIACTVFRRTTFKFTS